MRKTLVVLSFSILICASAFAADPFDGIHCGAEIPKLLIGKRSSNEPTATVEARHKDLGLKDLGGTEISDRLFLQSWQICGKEYELLSDTKSGVILDVLAFPAHSKTAPMYIGSCRINGKEAHGTVLAVLDNSANFDGRDRKLEKTMLQATVAWRIDEAHAKFAEQPAANVKCPLGGINTVDGGP